MICAVQRTGSGLLVQSLTDTGEAGRPTEHFVETRRELLMDEWGVPSDDHNAYVTAIWSHATTPNGVLGTKLMWNTFQTLKATVPFDHDDPHGLRFLDQTFPNPRFIWLRRNDKVRQGVSWWRAAVSDEWYLPVGQEPSRPELDVSKIVPLGSVRRGVRGRLAAVVRHGRDHATRDRLRGHDS